LKGWPEAGSDWRIICREEKKERKRELWKPENWEHAHLYRTGRPVRRGGGVFKKKRRGSETSSPGPRENWAIMCDDSQEESGVASSPSLGESY